MSFRVRCDSPGCVHEADAEESSIGRTVVEQEVQGVMAAAAPPGWTTNNGLGGVWRTFCPDHPQPEISGG